MIIRDPKELMWASGLFEGEGSFTVGKGGKRNPDYVYPQASIHMTDFDTVKRFHKIIGFGQLNGPYTYNNPAHAGVKQTIRKPSMYWRCAGFEKVQALIALLWSGLGERRRSRAKEILELGRKLSVPKTRNVKGQFC